MAWDSQRQQLSLPFAKAIREGLLRQRRTFPLRTMPAAPGRCCRGRTCGNHPATAAPCALSPRGGGPLRHQAKGRVAVSPLRECQRPAAAESSPQQQPGIHIQQQLQKSLSHQFTVRRPSWPMSSQRASRRAACWSSSRGGSTPGASRRSRSAPAHPAQGARHPGPPGTGHHLLPNQAIDQRRLPTLGKPRVRACTGLGRMPRLRRSLS